MKNPRAPDGCPFCAMDPQTSPLHNAAAFAVRDNYPVTVGHTLVIPRRHVPTWFEATPDEQRAIMELVEQAKHALDRELSPSPDGYNIGINVGHAAGQTVNHLHVHLIPRHDGDVDDPTGGVRLVIPSRGNYKKPGRVPVARGPAPGWKGQENIAGSADSDRPAPLCTGGAEDPFLAHLSPLFARARQVCILAAFMQDSGVIQLRKQIDSCLQRGVKIRVLTGDYLNLTQARALRHMLDLVRGEVQDPDAADETDGEDEAPRGVLELRVVEMSWLIKNNIGATFHPKSWIFTGEQIGAAFVGSSNISGPALTDGVEWNLRVDRLRDPDGFAEVVRAFDRWWERGRAVDADWLEDYSQRARSRDWKLPIGELDADDTPPPALWEIQQDVLDALRGSRQERRERALVVMATGMGKTMVTAADIEQYHEEQDRPPRVLFLAHRVELLRQAAATFRRWFPDARFGWYAGQHGDMTGDIVFASVMKLGRPDNLGAVEPRAFDYVVVDEVHHADAKTYRRILAHLRPRFLLGLTATPERADAGDILGLFDDHVAFRADLGVGIQLGHLVPFRYFGLKDTVDYRPENIPWRNRRFDPIKLARAVQTRARMERLWQAWRVGFTLLDGALNSINRRWILGISYLLGFNRGELAFVALTGRSGELTNPIRLHTPRWLYPKR